MLTFITRARPCQGREYMLDRCLGLMCAVHQAQFSKAAGINCYNKGAVMLRHCWWRGSRVDARLPSTSAAGGILQPSSSGSGSGPDCLGCANSHHPQTHSFRCVDCRIPLCAPRLQRKSCPGSNRIRTRGWCELWRSSTWHLSSSSFPQASHDLGLISDPRWQPGVQSL